MSFSYKTLFRLLRSKEKCLLYYGHNFEDATQTAVNQAIRLEENCRIILRFAKQKTLFFDMDRMLQSIYHITTRRILCDAFQEITGCSK